MSISTGELLEYRVAKIALHQGYFCRKRVSLRSLFFPDRVDVTDIDVLGIRFDTNFNRFTSFWECKAGQQDKPLDRILWLLGMGQYFGANVKTIVRPIISDRVKAFAKNVGVSAWDEMVLATQEKLFSETPISGSNDPEKYFKRGNENYRIIRNSKSLKKVYWFFNSGFWFETPDARLKKTLTAIEMCEAELRNSKPEIAQVARDLLLEGMILSSIAVLDFAGYLYTWQQGDLKKRVDLSLTSGLGSPEERKEIVAAAISYAEAVKGVKVSKQNELPLEIPPPNYALHLVDLLERFYERPNIAIQVPRFLEIVVYDFLLREKEQSDLLLSTAFPEKIEMLKKMSSNVVTFLSRGIGFPPSEIESVLKI